MRRVFISYGRDNFSIARRLYQDLQGVGAHPWIDQYDLLAGERWAEAIREAIRESSHFIALLSASTLSWRGYVQKEINQALEVLSEMPPDEIYIIPVRLDDCRPRHEQLRQIQWVDLFPSYELGFKQIVRTLEHSGALAANPNLVGTASAKDVNGLRQYRMLFDRPAFRFPCVFEGGLFEVEAATKSIAAAMGTGTLFSRDNTPLASITPIGNFESERFGNELGQIRDFLTAIQRTILQLIKLLEEAEGKSSSKKFSHMEFKLRDLIDAGVSQDFIRQAFSLMDQIDSERNTVLGRFNLLLNEANIRPLPLITLSSEQLKVSQEIELNNGEGPQLWEMFYLREHRFIRQFLEGGTRLNCPRH